MEEVNRKLTQELESIKGSYEEKLDSINQQLAQEKNRRIEAEEHITSLQNELDQLRDSLEEMKAR